MKTILLHCLLLLSTLGFSQDQLITILYENGTSDNSWQNGTRVFYIYTPDERLHSTLTQEYSFISEGWSDSQTSKFTYQDEILTGELLKVRTDSSWTNNVRTSYTYEGNDVTEVFTQVWVGHTWKNESRTQSTYAGDQKTEQVIAFFVNGAWENEAREVYTYNGDGLLEESIRYIWNGSWDPEIRHSYTYDSGGKLVLDKGDSYYNSMWNDYIRETHAYDGNGRLAISLAEMWTVSTWKNVLVTERIYNNDGTLHQRTFRTWEPEISSWTNTLRETYTYGVGFLGTTENTATDFNVYPNPAHGVLTIAFAQETETQIALMDLQGKLIHAEDFAGTKQIISLEAVPAGIYLLKAGNEVRKIAIR